MEKDTLHQKHSSEYASFLLKHHLEDLIKYTCEPAEGNIAPHCNQINEPAISISKNLGIQYLLNQLAEGSNLNWIENLKNNQKRNVKLKSEMIRLISEFTKDVEIAKSIFLDLEEIFINNEIVYINNVISEKKEIENKLKEAKIELQNTKAELLQILKKIENNTHENSLIFDSKEISLTKTTNDLDDFICAASHELKAPIANIEGLTTCLNQKTNKEDEDTLFMIGLINISILKFKETIKDLCDIPYLQRASNEDIEIIDLKNLVEDIHSNIIKNTPGFTALIKTDFSKYPFIRFSIKNLRRIITNLISSTLKYNSLDSKPEIFIKTDGVDSYMLLSIKYKGLSIPINEKSKDKPLSQKLQDHIDGAGIGLYIVKRIIEQENGKIEIESQDNQSLEFKIYLKN
jgi:K+-sensing histidine kinase KdpD